jgi:hypothetical protein
MILGVELKMRMNKEHKEDDTYSQKWNFFATGSRYIAQAGLKLLILLPQPSKCCTTKVWGERTTSLQVLEPPSKKGRHCSKEGKMAGCMAQVAEHCLASISPWVQTPIPQKKKKKKKRKKFLPHKPSVVSAMLLCQMAMSTGTSHYYTVHTLPDLIIPGCYSFTRKMNKFEKHLAVSYKIKHILL